MTRKGTSGLLAAALAWVACIAPVHAQESSAIGFESAAEAYETLTTRSDLKVSTRRGWTTVEDVAANALWTFVPSTDPAYPTVMRRTFVLVGGSLSVDMAGRCEASEATCNALAARLKRQSDAALAILPPHGRYLDGGALPPINRLTQ